MFRADNLTTFMCRLSSNMGASTSWNPQGLSRPVMGLLYLYLYLLLRMYQILHLYIFNVLLIFVIVLKMYFNTVAMFLFYVFNCEP